jgi:hypothetical protein
MKNGLTLWAFWLGVLAFVIALATSQRWQTLASWRYAAWVVAVSVCVCVLLFAFYTRRFWPIWGWKTFWLAQAIGMIAVGYWLDLGFRMVNCGLDRSPPIRQATAILAYERYKAQRYVRVEMPSVGAQVKIFIPRLVYETLSEGMRVEVTYRRGTLGMPWCGSDAVRPLNP